MGKRLSDERRHSPFASAEERLLAYSRRDPETGCLLWTRIEDVLAEASARAWLKLDGITVPHPVPDDEDRAITSEIIATIRQMSPDEQAELIGGSVSVHSLLGGGCVFRAMGPSVHEETP